MDFKAITAGAVCGFASAAMTDFNAWQKFKAKSDNPEDQFSWSLAFKRWVAGAMTGAFAAAGWNVSVTP